MSTRFVLGFGLLLLGCASCKGSAADPTSQSCFFQCADATALWCHFSSADDEPDCELRAEQRCRDNTYRPDSALVQSSIREACWTDTTYDPTCAPDWFLDECAGLQQWSEYESCVFACEGDVPRCLPLVYVSASTDASAVCAAEAEVRCTLLNAEVAGATPLEELDLCEGYR